jgi:hypothetical protein
MGRLAVDGEVFDLRTDASGSTHYDWVSGPNRGYGFGSLCSDRGVPTDEEHVQAIRGFLSAIDPETGYMD